MAFTTHQGMKKPEPEPIKACPKCGDTTHGYTFRTVETHVMSGAWGEQAECVDNVGLAKPLPANVTCLRCGKRSPRGQAEGE